MAQTPEEDDDESQNVPGSRPDDYLPASQAGAGDYQSAPSQAGPPAAPKIQPIRIGSGSNPDAQADFATLPEPPDTVVSPKPQRLIEPQEPQYSDDPNDDYANMRAATAYARQLDEYDARSAEQAQQQAWLSQKRQVNTSARQDSKTTGRQYDYDENGIATPRIDPTTGQQAVVERDSETQYDDQGRPYQVIQNPDNKPGRNIVDPDADAKIGVNPDDPNDKFLYKQNSNQPWTPIDPNQGILSTDPKVAVASAKFLHSNELRDTLNQRADLGLKIQQLRQSIPSDQGAPASDDDSGDDEPSTTIPAAGLSAKARLKAEEDLKAYSEATPQPGPQKSFFGGINQEATAQAQSQWSQAEKERQAQLAKTQSLIDADNQIKDARSQMLELSLKAQSLKEEGPGGYLTRKRAEANNSLADQIPLNLPGASPTDGPMAQIGQMDSTISSGSSDLQQRQQDLNEKLQAGGTADDFAQWDKERASIQADAQSLQGTLAQRNQIATQVQNAQSAAAAQQALSAQNERDELRSDPATAPAADQLDSLDQEAAQRKAKLASTVFSDPATQEFAQDALNQDLDQKRQLIISSVQAGNDSDSQQDQELNDKARQYLDLQNAASQRPSVTIGPGGLPNVDDSAESHALQQLEKFDQDPNADAIKQRASDLAADDAKLKFTDGSGYATLHNGNVVINPQSMLPDGLRPKGLAPWDQQITQAEADGKISDVQASQLKGQLGSQAQQTQGQIIYQTLNNDAFKHWLSQNDQALFDKVKTGNQNPDLSPTNAQDWSDLRDQAAQFLKTNPTWSDKIRDTVLKTAMSTIPSMVGDVATATGVGMNVGGHADNAVGKWLQDVGIGEKELGTQMEDPRLRGYLPGEIGKGVGSLAMFMAPGSIVGKTAKAIGMSDAAAGLLSQAAIGATGAVQNASQIYTESRDMGLSEKQAFLPFVLGGVAGSAVVLPVTHLLSTFAAPVKNALVKAITNSLTEAASFSALNTVQGISNNAIAQQCYDKNRDVFDGILGSAGSGAATGAIMSLIGSVVGGVRMAALKRDYQLPPTWKGNPEDLVAADHQINQIHLAPDYGELKDQRDALLEQVRANPDLRQSVGPQIAAVNQAMQSDPAKTPPESRPVLAKALVKIAQGVPMDQLSETERAVVQSAKTSSGVAFVEDHQGNPIISNTAKEWLGNVAPGAADLIKMNAAQARSMVDQKTPNDGGQDVHQEATPEAASEPSQAPSDKIQTPSQQQGIEPEDAVNSFKFSDVKTPESIDEWDNLRNRRIQAEKSLLEQQIGITPEQSERLHDLAFVRNFDSRALDKWAKKNLSDEQFTKYENFFDGPYNQKNGPVEFWNYDEYHNPALLKNEADKAGIAHDLVSAFTDGKPEEGLNDKWVWTVSAIKRLNELGGARSDISDALREQTGRVSGSESGAEHWYRTRAAEINAQIDRFAPDMPLEKPKSKAEPPLTPSTRRGMMLSKILQAQGVDKTVADHYGAQKDSEYPTSGNTENLRDKVLNDFQKDGGKFPKQVQHENETQEYWKVAFPEDGPEKHQAYAAQAKVNNAAHVEAAHAENQKLLPQPRTKEKPPIPRPEIRPLSAREQNIAKGLSVQLQRKGVSSDAADAFARQHVRDGKDTKDIASDFEKAGGIAKQDQIRDSILTAEELNGKSVDEMTKEATDAYDRILKREKAPPMTNEEKKKISRAIEHLAPALARWKKAFSKIRFTGHELESAGVSIQTKKNSLDISVGDLLNPSNIESLISHPERPEALLSEEAAHAFLVKAANEIGAKEGKTGSEVAGEIFDSLPRQLKKDIYTTYNQGKTRALNTAELGHEFLRMVLQGKISLEGGSIKMGNHIISEQTLPAHIITKIKGCLQRVVAYLKQLSANLKADGVDQASIDRIEAITSNAFSALKSMRTQVDAERAAEYSDHYDASRIRSRLNGGGLQTPGSSAAPSMGKTDSGGREVLPQNRDGAGGERNLLSPKANQHPPTGTSVSPDNGRGDQTGTGGKEGHDQVSHAAVLPGGDGANEPRPAQSELEKQLAQLQAEKEASQQEAERAQERRNLGVQKRAEMTADKERVLSRVPEDARAQAEELLSKVQMGDPTYVLAANRERLPAAYIAVPPGEVQTSHSGSDFHKNPNYGGENTRAYHSDEAEQNKVRSMALPGALDEDSMVTDAKSASGGAPQVVLAVFNDAQGHLQTRLQTAGGNGREQGVNLSTPEDQDRLSDAWKAKENQFGLNGMHEGWRGYRFLGVYDLRNEAQNRAYLQLVDKLNPNHGVVQDTAARADIDAALKIPVGKLLHIPLTMSPETAREELVKLVKDSEKLGLDRNLMAGLLKNPTQAQFYMQRLLLAAAFRSKSLGDFFTSTQITSGHATVAGLIKAATETALHLRDAGHGNTADAIGRTLERIAEYVKGGERIGQAIRRAEQQTEMGPDGPIINSLAEALARKIAYHPLNKKGIKPVDSDETVAGFEDLMRDLTKAISNHSDEDDIFGEKRTLGDTLQAGINAHFRKVNPPEDEEGGAVLKSRSVADDPIRRMRQLTRKRQEEGLNRYETDELTNLEKKQGQSFMPFFDEARKNPDFALEQQGEETPQPTPKPTAQQTYLFSPKVRDEGDNPLEKNASKEETEASERLQKSITPERRTGDPGGEPALHLESAKAFLEGNARSGGDAQRESSSGPGSRKQQIEKLAEWAKGEGILLSKFPRRFDITRHLDEDEGGQEHAAIPDEKSGRWVKVTRGSTGFGKFPKESKAGGWELRAATPLEYLDRLDLSNKVFGDDLQLHAVVQDRHGNTNIITSQPDYVGERLGSDEISQDMGAQGFQRLDENVYYKEDGNILVMDLHDGNAVRGPDGKMHVFDAIMLHPDESLVTSIKDGAVKAAKRQAIEDGSKSADQRLREISPLVKETVSDFSDHPKYNQQEAAGIARKAFALASRDFDPSKGIPYVSVAKEAAKSALQEKYPGSGDAQRLLSPKVSEESPDQLQLDFGKAKEDGEKTALQRLKDSQPVIDREVSRFSNTPSFDKDEAAQRARLAVARASKSFDSSKGVPFDAYATTVVRNELRTMYKQELQHATRFPTTLDAPASEGSDESNKDQTPSDSAAVPDIAAHREAERMLNEIIPKFPQRMQDVLRGVMGGDNGQEIADRMGISRQAVNNLQKAAFVRMRGMLGERGVKDVESLLSRRVASEEEYGPEDGSPEDHFDEMMKTLHAGINHDEIGGNQEKAAAEEGTGKEKKIGRPDLAGGAGINGKPSDKIRGIDQYYSDHFQPETMEEWQRAADDMLAKDRKGVEAKILKEGLMGKSFDDPAMVIASNRILNELQDRMINEGTTEARNAFNAFWLAKRGAGSEWGRVGRAMNDPLLTPSARHAAFLREMIMKPREAAQKAIDKETDPKKKVEIMNAEMKAVFERLRQAGISPDDILKDKVTFRIQTKKYMDAVTNLLSRAVGSHADARKKAFELIRKGRSYAQIEKETGISEEEAKGIKKFAIAKLRKDLFAKFKAGASGDDGTFTTGKEVADDEAEKEFKKFLENSGIVDDDKQGKPRFDIEDPAHVLRMKRAIEKAKEDTGLLDMAYEYWVNELVSAPSTSATVGLSNLVAGAWDTTIQRFAEASFNLGVKDKNAAQFGEFKVLAKGIIPGIARAWQISAKSYAAEHDFYGSTVLGTPFELDRPNMIKAAIPGTLGKVVRFGARNLLWVEHMTHAVLGNMEAGAQAYRMAKARGLSGKALSDKTALLSKTKGEIVSDYLPKAKPSDDMVKFFANSIAREHEGIDPGDLISDKTSDAWSMAREQTAFDQARKDGWSPEAWEKGYAKGMETTFKQDLKTSAQGGNMVEDIAAKIQNARYDNKLAGTIFPFVKTPYNIARIGIRKTPFGSVNLAYQMAKGFLSLRNFDSQDGKTRTEMYLTEHPDLVRDLAEQAIAWGTMAVLYGAVQGDKDDDNKQLLITGSADARLESAGIRELNDRANGGEYVIRIGGRSGFSIPYGRMEPFSTTLGTVADAIRAIKRNGSGADNMKALMNYMMGQARNKTFLPAISTIANVMEGGNTPGNMAKKAILTALVPNLIREPIRALDDYVRDTKTAGASYDLLPLPSNAQPKINAYGEPMKKSGNPLLRVFVSTPLATDPTIRDSDRLLANWNRENPSEEWAPTAPKNVVKIDGKEQEMTAEETARFQTAAGRIFSNSLKEIVNGRNVENPRHEDIEDMKRAYQAAERTAKERLFNPAYLARRNAGALSPAR